uniref:Nuclear receptor domain-containing protein n=1 Tax=Panagrellus redivivus TaxID=6233 RepID=A0A7E4UW33_PANRE
MYALHDILSDGLKTEVLPDLMPEPKQCSCAICSGNVRRICAACRLKKCVSVGMKESEVLSLGITSLKLAKKQEGKQLCVSSIRENDLALMPTIQKFDHSSNFSAYQNNEWLQQILLAKQSIEHQRGAMLPPKTSSFYDTCILSNVIKQIFNESRLCQVYLTDTGIMNIAKDVVDVVDIVTLQKAFRS